eukprot:scaffold80285_cov18-Tisochrysis_lutea.AAC.1
MLDGGEERDGLGSMLGPEWPPSGTQAAGGGADGAAGGVGVGAAGRGVVVQLVGLQWCRWWPPSCIQAAGAGEAQEGMGRSVWWYQA